MHFIAQRLVLSYQDYLFIISLISYHLLWLYKICIYHLESAVAMYISMNYSCNILFKMNMIQSKGKLAFYNIFEYDRLTRCFNSFNLLVDVYSYFELCDENKCAHTYLLYWNVMNTKFIAKHGVNESLIKCCHTIIEHTYRQILL